MIRGPFVLRMDGEEVVSAMISLVVESEKFRIGVDIPQGEDDTNPIHAEMGWTNSFSSFGGDIKSPTSPTPLQDMIDALDALIPDEPLGMPQGIDFDDSGSSLDEMDNFAPIQ